MPVGPQPYAEEEERRQNLRYEVLHRLHYRALELPLRQDHPEKECPEEGVRAAGVGYVSTEQNPGHDENYVLPTVVLVLARPLKRPLYARADDKEAETDVNRGGDDGEGAAVVRGSHGEDEEEPAQEVGDDGGGQGGAADVGVEEFQVGKEAGEVGKVGGGDGEAPEEGTEAVGIVAGNQGKVIDKEIVEGVADGERDHDAGEGGGERLFAAAEDGFKIDLQADYEHEVDQPYACYVLQVLYGSPWNYVFYGQRSESQHRWTQYYTTLQKLQWSENV